MGITMMELLLYPTPCKAVFFPGLVPPAPLCGARPGRSGAGRTGMQWFIKISSPHL